MQKKLKSWIEATRLRTLPVSTAGVVVASGCAYNDGSFKWQPALLCFLLPYWHRWRQISPTNISTMSTAPTKKDVRDSDAESPRATSRRGQCCAPRLAPFATACAVGCCLIPFGGWQLIPIGVVIAVFALAYSAGPYPLSRVGLGDVAVFVFFGFVPVCLTYYVQTGEITGNVAAASAAVGLMGCNVLIVNNYRDVEDDREAGKRTTVVRFGRRVAAIAYLLFGIAAVWLTAPLWAEKLWIFFIAPAIYLCLHYSTWQRIRRSRGAALNPLLGATARNMLVYSLLLLAVCLI